MRALQMSETQLSIVITLTVFNLVALSFNPSAPPWAWFACALLYPTLAVGANFLFDDDDTEKKP